MTRKLRPAVEIVSDIGSLAFDLQHHREEEIAEAVAMLRTVNPEMFRWLSRALEEPPSTNAVGQRPEHPTCVRANEESELSDRLPVGRLVDPPQDELRELFDFLKVKTLKDAKQSITGLRERVIFTKDYETLQAGRLVDPQEHLLRSLLERAVAGLSQGACFTCGAEPGVNIDCAGCRWVSDAQAALLAARVDPSPLAQTSEKKDDQSRVVSVPGTAHGDLPRPPIEVIRDEK